MRNGNCTAICGEHSAATSNLFVNRVELSYELASTLVEFFYYSPAVVYI
jgi:hypothetical protein